MNPKPMLTMLILVALGGISCDRSQNSSRQGNSRPAIKAPCLPCRGHEIAVTAETPHCEHDGKTYYFCSGGCLAAFQKSPEKYLPQAATRPAGPTTVPFAPVGSELLPNAHRVTDNVFSGGQPEGEEAFKKLRELGVKTIISVDGARPDVELAKKYGMRYVHLPFGYGGVPEDQAKAIAKALVEISGPFYIHCHHGKHRSAAAVAVACVLNGMLPPDQAEPVLVTFGTGQNYAGLWKSAREAKPMDLQALRGLKVAFPESVKLPALAESMVAIDEHFNHLKLIQQSSWTTPKNHPDIDAAHEARQVQEILHELGRSDALKSKPDDFRKMLQQSEEAMAGLRQAIASRQSEGAALDLAMKSAAASCAACHKTYRD